MYIFDVRCQPLPNHGTRSGYYGCLMMMLICPLINQQPLNIQQSTVKGQNRLDFRKYSFSQRTVNEWNKLSADCVHSSSVNMFKNRIDNYLVRAGYT